MTEEPALPELCAICRWPLGDEGEAYNGVRGHAYCLRPIKAFDVDPVNVAIRKRIEREIAEVEG